VLLAPQQLANRVVFNDDNCAEKAPHQLVMGKKKTWKFFSRVTPRTFQKYILYKVPKKVASFSFSCSQAKLLTIAEIILIRESSIFSFT
jgi:hypothetical protein